MTMTFYWVWSVLGILIILFVVVISVLIFMFARRAYNLIGLIYDEQQELMNRIANNASSQKVPEEVYEEPSNLGSEDEDIEYEKSEEGNK